MANRQRQRKRSTRWLFSQQFLGAVTSGATAAVTLITTGTGTETILRTRGELLVWLDSTPAANETQGWAAGLIVMPEGQSTTVVSSPITDGNAPYYWYEQGGIASEDTAPVGDSLGIKAARIVVDSKAMRIIRPDREVQFVVETQAFVGTAVVNFLLSTRTLVGES